MTDIIGKHFGGSEPIFRAWQKVHTDLLRRNRLGMKVIQSGSRRSVQLLDWAPECCNEFHKSVLHFERWSFEGAKRHADGLLHFYKFCKGKREVALERWPEVRPLISELSLWS